MAKPTPPAPTSEPQATRQTAAASPTTPAKEPPPTRRLRVFAFDPSITTEMANYDVSEVVVRIPWERDRWSADGKTTEKGLEKGPIGDYLEVVDVDPASERVYDPVDLEDPHLIATDGLAPSEGNPQFHQQMVYAVAMTTIGHFERALGRQIFWSDMARRDGSYALVQRLRLYPHALREENAYYDPSKKAILFGYFPARPAVAADGMPGGITFSCLSHDIIAHETTHAILDGLQRYYMEPNNGDVLAFHEAFADLVAVFQHFTYPEVLRHQIAQARGNLDTEQLLGKLALQFGKATGRRSALRDFIERDEKGNRITRPELVIDEQEPHKRGALLVASLFDAFLAIYRHRTRDLLRIATGGTGILPSGDLHPDLVERLSQEAAKAAKQLLLMVIRAIDYCPPVDITYGDYMRALITADYDLVPEDERNYRVAIIEAFRGWGIYPRDVRTLSVDSLRWERPKDTDPALEFSNELRPVFFSDALSPRWDRICHGRVLSKGERGTFRKLSRMEVAAEVKQFSALFHDEIGKAAGALVRSGRLRLTDKPFGLNVGYGHADDHKFEIHQVRPVRRQAPDGAVRQDLLIQITQRRPAYFDAQRQKKEEARYMSVDQQEAPSKRPDFWFRGGVTLMLDLESFEVRYAIQKDVLNTSRLDRQRDYVQGTTGLSLRELYFGALDGRDRLAALHGADD